MHSFWDPGGNVNKPAYLSRQSAGLLTLWSWVRARGGCWRRRSSRMARGVLRPQPVQVCSHRSIQASFGALNYVLALVKLGLVPTAGVSVTVCGFVGAMGSVGITMSGRLVFREEIAVLPGRHRLVQQQAWFSELWSWSQRLLRCSCLSRLLF